MTTATTRTALAWHGDPGLKAEVLDRLRQHRAEDSIVKGIYQCIDSNLGTGYRGCAIGCTLPPQDAINGVDFDDEVESPDEGWHGRVEELYGIPTPIAHLIDRIFENLPTDDEAHARFAVEVIAAVPVAADLSLVVSRFLLDVLADPEHGVRRHTAEGSRRRAQVDRVIDLYRRMLAGEEIGPEQWRAAAAADDAAADDAAADDAAAAAYAAAAYAAADAADAYGAAAYAYAAAYAAAYAYAYAAAAAADDAADAADAYGAAARHQSRIWQAERLIHHIANAPVGVSA